MTFSRSASQSAQPAPHRALSSTRMDEPKHARLKRSVMNVSTDGRQRPGKASLVALREISRRDVVHWEVERSAFSHC
jgi:hypothetical protein